MDPNKTKVLSTEVNTFKRRIKEAIQIKLTKPALKGQCHEDFSVLGHFCAKFITLRL